MGRDSMLYAVVKRVPSGKAILHGLQYDAVFPIDVFLAINILERFVTLRGSGDVLDKFMQFHGRSLLCHLPSSCSSRLRPCSFDSNACIDITTEEVSFAGRFMTWPAQHSLRSGPAKLNSSPRKLKHVVLFEALSVMKLAELVRRC